MCYLIELNPETKREEADPTREAITLYNKSALKELHD